MSIILKKRVHLVDQVVGIKSQVTAFTISYSRGCVQVDRRLAVTKAVGAYIAPVCGAIAKQRFLHGKSNLRTVQMSLDTCVTKVEIWHS